MIIDFHTHIFPDKIAGRTLESHRADQKKFVTLFDQMPLTEEEKMAVFSGNAKKLLGI